jgi:hypothetical protein
LLKYSGPSRFSEEEQKIFRDLISDSAPASLWSAVLMKGISTEKRKNELSAAKLHPGTS